jgi:uncharacterized protein (TIGR03066 family)
MKPLLFTVAGLLALGAAVRADDKSGGSNAQKIVGTWEVTKGETIPVGSTIEFDKAGKFKMVVKQGTQSMSFEGTYKVNGDNLTVTMKAPNGQTHEETMTIKTLTDKEFVTVDDKKKVDTFKKK